MNIRVFFKDKSVLNRLIIANVAIFLCVWIVELALMLFGFLTNTAVDDVMNRLIHAIAMPATGQQILQHPWSIITSLLLHTEFWHILFNMLMLFIAGRIFCLYFSEKKLLFLYFLGGICGNIFYVTVFNMFPAFDAVKYYSVAVGASGCIMAILAAVTLHKPNHQLRLLLLRPIALKWIMLVFVIIDLLSIPKTNAGGHIAHLGGALCGALYALCVRKINFSIKRKKKNRKKQKFSTSFNDTSQQTRYMSDEEYNARKVQQEKKVDVILAKISKAGYDALTKEEKDFLFFYSKK